MSTDGGLPNYWCYRCVLPCNCAVRPNGRGQQEFQIQQQEKCAPSGSHSMERWWERGAQIMAKKARLPNDGNVQQSHDISMPSRRTAVIPTAVLNPKYCTSKTIEQGSCSSKEGHTPPPNTQLQYLYIGGRYYSSTSAGTLSFSHRPQKSCFRNSRFRCD